MTCVKEAFILLELVKANGVLRQICFLCCMLAEVIKITDVKHFPAALWLIFIVCVGYYVAVFPFIGLGQ